MCLRGVSELQDQWLARTDDPEVAVFVVWSPQLGAEEGDVGEATTLIPDSRVRHYWDPDMLAGRTFAPQVGTRDPAWDVWLLFDRDARWTDDALPELSWWAHQLQGLPAERRLDPERFTRKARELQRR